jgi:hypothetical protein
MRRGGGVVNILNSFLGAGWRMPFSLVEGDTPG